MSTWQKVTPDTSLESDELDHFDIPLSLYWNGDTSLSCNISRGKLDDQKAHKNFAHKAHSFLTPFKVV